MRDPRYLPPRAAFDDVYKRVGRQYRVHRIEQYAFGVWMQHDGPVAILIQEQAERLRQPPRVPGMYREYWKPRR